MFGTHSQQDYQVALPGIERKTLVHGEKTLMVEFRLKRGSVLPIGDEVRELAVGDAWCIAGGVEHGAEVLEEAVAVEVFAPVREDYLARP